VVELYRIIPTTGLPGLSAVVPTFNVNAPVELKVAFGTVKFPVLGLNVNLVLETF
jgi:hypothetical protein